MRRPSLPEGGRVPEVWGGLECTVNRIGNAYLDQVARTGHARRPLDLELIAELGFRTLRYPLLWERTAPLGAGRANWAWADARMAQLRSLGIRPIAGLVHHGSGPSFTDLLDPGWGHHLAHHAGAVARRYPWIDWYTPVNEPLTTARFSGLYGHWYPHHRNDRSFARAVINQGRGVVLSMRAIRAVNPAASLMQTEDLGFVQAVPELRYQADFENERRWLTFDLLSGRVTRDHPLHQYLLWCGIPAADLAWFEEHATPPQLLGINYYVVSERYLDKSPKGDETDGGNGRERYRDLEAARSIGLIGIAELLRQAWIRYGTPLVLSEAHLAGPVDEQYRWLVHMWDAACAAQANGIDLRAMTIWSLLGAWDWDRLCTVCGDYYEPGVFDVRSGLPRGTELAEAIPFLVRGMRPEHRFLSEPGWWEAPCPVN